MADKEKFLADLQSENKDLRFAAWRDAGTAPPETIPQLVRLASEGNPGVAKAAREAITTMVHAAGKDPSDPRRASVVKHLIEALSAQVPSSAKAHLFRLLSLIAPEESSPEISKWLSDADLREEAVFCLERLPGRAPLKAVAAAYRAAPTEFKPRLLAALGHRRAEEGIPLCLEVMRSGNKDLVLAATRAFGRIGGKPSGSVRFNEPAGLSEWEKIDYLDAQLRYADAQRDQGNHAEAIRIYKAYLDRPEPHWQCAAVIGISRMGTAEAAAAIFPKLRSADRTVRNTAVTAWQSMAKA